MIVTPQETLKALDKIIMAFNCWRWIPIEEMLPPMFVNVLTNGIDGETNRCPIARRFTGWASGWDGIGEKKEAPWYWLTPCDRPIKQVTYWMIIPNHNGGGMIFHTDYNVRNCVKPESYSIEFSKQLLEKDKD